MSIINFSEINEVIEDFNELDSLKLQTSSYDESRHNLNIKAKNIIKSIDLEVHFINEITRIQKQSQKRALEFYQDRVSELERDSIIKKEFELRSLELDMEFGELYRNDKSDYRKALDFTNFMGIISQEEKLLKISKKLVEIIESKYPYINSLIMLNDFTYHTELSIFYRHIYSWIKGGKEKVVTTKKYTLEGILVEKVKYKAIINFLNQDQIISSTKNGHEWTGSKADTTLKPKTSLYHFAVYLFLNNYLLITTLDKEIVSALCNEFNLKIYATNYSRIRDRVSSNPIGKDKDYQDLFSNLP